MRLIGNTSDIFGKLPPGLPGARMSADGGDLFGLGAGRHKGRKGPKAVKMVEDHDEVPEIMPGDAAAKTAPESSPMRKTNRHVRGWSWDASESGDGMFGLGQAMEVSPERVTNRHIRGWSWDSMGQTGPATPPAGTTSPGGPQDTHPHDGPNWVVIGIGVAVVAGIIGFLIYNSQKAPAGAMGGVSSKKARKFIRRQTKKLIKAGMPQKRAVAAAYSMARQKHYKVPAKH